MLWTSLFQSSDSALTCDSGRKDEILNVRPSALVCLDGPCVFAGTCESALKEELPLSGQDDHFGPKFYYDRAKSFFDNISSDMKLR